MNIKKAKIMTVLGTRPEIIRLSRILPMLDRYADHVIVYTSQSYDYEMSDIFFKELELRKPNYVLHVKAESLGQQIGNILSKVEEVFIKEKPDALFVLGDTNSSLSAIMARRHKIPIFHMEAGNRSFDRNVPEETNRAIVDHISDYNFAYTEHARRYLIAEGIHPGTIYVTGTPLTEVFDHFVSKIDKSNILKELKLTPEKYFLVSTHREENVENNAHIKELFTSINKLAKDYNFPVVISLHPRTRKRLTTLGIKVHKDVLLHKPFGFMDYNKLQKHAFCVLSDSGSVPEEAAIFKFPAVQIRVSSERPESFDAGTIQLTGFSHDTITTGVQLAIDSHGKKAFRIPYDYTDTNVSTKVTKLILGLTAIKNSQ